MIYHYCEVLCLIQDPDRLMTTSYFYSTVTNISNNNNKDPPTKVLQVLISSVKNPSCHVLLSENSGWYGWYEPEHWCDMSGVMHCHWHCGHPVSPLWHIPAQIPQIPAELGPWSHLIMLQGTVVVVKQILLKLFSWIFSQETRFQSQKIFSYFI